MLIVFLSVALLVEAPAVLIAALLLGSRSRVKKLEYRCSRFLQIHIEYEVDGKRDLIKPTE